MLMKNEVSFSVKSWKCGSSVTRRIYSARGADGCECIFGSFEDSEAGDCSAIVKAVRGFLMVSATLLPTLFVLK